MFNTKDSDRSNWVVQREYQDAEGVIRIEYRDSLGKIYTEAKDPNQQAKIYQSGYVDGALVEHHQQSVQLKQQEVADKKISMDLLVGLIIAGLVGITATMAYYLFQVNSPSPMTVVTMPIYETKPVPSLSPTLVEKSVTNITPAQSAKLEPQDFNQTITTPSKAAQPAATIAPQVIPKVTQTVQPVKPATIAVEAPARPSPSEAKPIAPKPMASVPPVVLSPNTPIPNTVSSLNKTDVQLKEDIVQKLNEQFSNSQLLVDVNQGNVKISGTVTTPGQLEQIQPLVRSMEGVKTINVEVTLKISSN
ncbi:BON domain-containing protein [Synechocystis sp. LEGE 06083]|uniref:BON domain-containing protein n=1 Tax=Synechocystis sp. LEGE 06083 TaxID=915336 RepID=UPI0018825F7F|nr:BON domain-containing protein [Synechocystis sp. LEGE 06083]MBE9197323.1 BON domain-containing protein [Synechocystis sp. LEGE 06083]